jgi:hypothetical protein
LIFSKNVDLLKSAGPLNLTLQKSASSINREPPKSTDPWNLLAVKSDGPKNDVLWNAASIRKSDSLKDVTLWKKQSTNSAISLNLAWANRESPLKRVCSNEAFLSNCVETKIAVSLKMAPKRPRY